jgi:hypothetical protein
MDVVHGKTTKVGGNAGQFTDVILTSRTQLPESILGTL